VPESVDIPELALSREDFLAPFAGHTEGLRERSKQFDDLGNMVVVFAVLGAGLRIEEIVACDQLKYLLKNVS
jgi:hypothetical protein